MAQNGILFLGLWRISSITSKKKSKIMTQLPEREAEDDVIILFAEEPLASQQFI